MSKRSQWEANLTIQAAVKEVWAAMEDLSSIPKVHPEVRNVQFLSGQSSRGEGVEYMCVVPDGPRKGTCVERVVEHISLQKTSTLSVRDDWGLSELLLDFVTDAIFEPIGSDATRVRMVGYYRTKGVKNWILNLLFVRPKMKKRATAVMRGYKRLIEQGQARNIDSPGRRPPSHREEGTQ